MSSASSSDSEGSDSCLTSNSVAFASRDASLMVKKGARFILIIGPMTSGKSTETIKYVYKYSVHGSVVVINSVKDTRCGESIKTHDNREVPAIKVSDLHVDIQGCKDANLIVIDEGQFFDQKQLIAFVKALMDLGKKVLVSGLDGDSNQNAFLDLNLLVPLATEVIKLSAFCGMCKDETIASYTVCTGKKKGLIDVSAKYVPVCYYHCQHPIQNQ